MSNPWTPGPWEACERGAYGDFDGNSQVIIGDDMRVAVVQNSGNDWAFANARLIAAAPEMAEVLKKTERHMVSFYRASSPAGNVGNENAFADNDAIIIEIRTLLTRIRGEQT